MNAKEVLSMDEHNENKYSKYFELGAHCFTVSNVLSDTMNQRKYEKGSFSLYEEVLLCNSYLAGESFRSVFQLCSVGLLPDAETLGRKILETAVTILYISTNPEKLSKDYVAFEAVASLKLLDQARNGHNMPETLASGMISREETIEKNNHETLSNLNVTDDEIMRLRSIRSWSGLHLMEMAKRCASVKGLYQEVYSAYKMFCLSTHTNAAYAGKFVSSDGLLFGPPIDQDSAPPILLKSAHLFLYVLESVNAEFNLGCDESMIKFRSDIESCTF